MRNSTDLSSKICNKEEYTFEESSTISTNLSKCLNIYKKQYISTYQLNSTYILNIIGIYVTYRLKQRPRMQFRVSESAMTHDFPDWAHHVDRFTLTRNRNYRWLRKMIELAFARGVLHRAMERARVSKLQIFVSSPWNALAREVRCLCFHGKIVYRDISPLSNSTFSTVAWAERIHTIFLRQLSAVTMRN